MNRYVRLFAHLFTLLALVFLLACTRHYFRAQAAAAEGVSVQPIQVWTGGDKLWVRVMVLNESSEPIKVSRDAMTARLPDGQVVGRAMGKTTMHYSYIIPPGEGRQVYVEFAGPGVDWDTVRQATVDFSSGITRDGQPLPLRMVVEP